MERSNTLPAAGELETLESFLDFQRATMIQKVEGLTDEQAASRSVAPSTLSLSGLIKHLTLVEESWFQSVFAGEESVPYPADHACISTALVAPGGVLVLDARPGAPASCVLARNDNADCIRWEFEQVKLHSTRFIGLTSPK